MFPFLGLLKDMRNRMENLRVYAKTSIVKAREYIFDMGNTVDGTKVEQALGDGSWVPVLVSMRHPPFCRTAQTSNSQNSFVEKLGPLGLDPFRMLVVDFMHECELGTWKALFIHLVRILYALPFGNQLVATLDSR
jgi:hypothetical protein